MDLTTITINDFKNLFFRNFPYLPLYSSTKLYKVNDIVYYSTNENFYICIQENTGFPPTETEYWTLYSDDILNYVLDEDIEKAFLESMSLFNESLFDNDDEIKLYYLYLTAHFLVLDIQAASQGISNTSAFPVKSQKVGNVSQDFEFPSKWANEPIFNFYTKTYYGLKYLHAIFPKLTGHVGLLLGTTTPDWNITRAFDLNQI